MQFFEEKIKLDIFRVNAEIGRKCNFRNGPWITFEAEADAMFA